MLGQMVRWSLSEKKSILFSEIWTSSMQQLLSGKYTCYALYSVIFYQQQNHISLSPNAHPIQHISSFAAHAQLIEVLTHRGMWLSSTYMKNSL